MVLCVNFYYVRLEMHFLVIFLYRGEKRRGTHITTEFFS